MSEKKINFDELIDIQAAEQENEFNFTFTSKVGGEKKTQDYLQKFRVSTDSYPSVEIVDELIEEIFSGNPELSKFHKLLKKNIDNGFEFINIKIPFNDIEFNPNEEKYFDGQTIDTRKKIFENYKDKRDNINFFIFFHTGINAAQNVRLIPILIPMPFIIHIDIERYSVEQFNNSSFLCNIFTKEINWKHFTFGIDKENSSQQNKQDSSHTIFDKAIFLKEVSFSHYTFHTKADFIATQFNKKVWFYRTKFKEKADFRWTTFKQGVNFQLANFEETFFFNHVNPIKDKEKVFNSFPFNFKKAIIEKMDWEDTKLQVDQAENRETFLVLKQIAIKQNDNISALGFHTKEMEKYYSELKWFKNPINKLILCFEKNISYFGTNPLCAVYWFVFFNSVFFLFQTKFCICNFSFKILFEILFPFRAENPNLVHFLALIVNPILLYEIVKSFRKYSRKL